MMQAEGATEEEIAEALKDDEDALAAQARPQTALVSVC